MSQKNPKQKKLIKNHPHEQYPLTNIEDLCLCSLKISQLLFF